MERFLWVCLGGAIGTGARYLVSLWCAERFGGSFPYGTLVVNVVGCFLLALAMPIALHFEGVPQNLRLALTTGFLGGLTTYSSFNYESTKLFHDGEPRLALVNFATTVLACFIAGLLGLALAQRITSGPAS